MSFLKNFNIRWVWFVNKRGFRSGAVIVSIILMLAFLGAVVFMLGFLHNKEGERIISNDPIQIIGGISALVFIYLYSICGVYGNASNNFRIAIDEAKKFVVENPQCRPKINILIEETRGTKNPAKINEWRENQREFSSVKAEMQELEKEKEEMEKGIPLKGLKARIEARKERIKELESKLV